MAKAPHWLRSPWAVCRSQLSQMVLPRTHRCVYHFKSVSRVRADEAPEVESLGGIRQFPVSHDRITNGIAGRFLWDRVGLGTPLLKNPSNNDLGFPGNQGQTKETGRDPIFWSLRSICTSFDALGRCPFGKQRHSQVVVSSHLLAACPREARMWEVRSFLCNSQGQRTRRRSFSDPWRSHCFGKATHENVLTSPGLGTRWGEPQISPHPIYTAKTVSWYLLKNHLPRRYYFL